jgi:hypothetical protein
LNDAANARIVMAQRGRWLRQTVANMAKQNGRLMAAGAAGMNGADREDSIHSGGCLCGTVKFTAKGALRGVVYCHCTQCRRQSGHHFASTNIGNDRLSISGADAIVWYAASDDAKRGFCGTCGSVMFWKHRKLDYTSINAGAFDMPSGLKAEKHIFVADKGDYYDIDDGLPQFARSSADVVVAGD